jgi:hypothetical protein
MKPKKHIDFTKIEWDVINISKLEFFFKEAEDYNDVLLNDINNLNNKAFQLLTVVFPAISAAAGFLLATWGKEGKEPFIASLVVACVGLSLIVAFLLLAVFPRNIYPGRITPNIAFAGNLYKASKFKLLADGIASYHSYIVSNNRVLRYRSFFITAGAAGVFVVPLITVVTFLICFLN